VANEPPNKLGIARLCIRLLRYAARRWPRLIIVLIIMLLKTGMEVLKPLPMKILVDYVLNQQPLQGLTSRFVEIIPSAATREGLLAWTVAATILLFFLGWALGLASSYANIEFGQRMVYDLAEDLYRHLQGLSLRFHAHKSIGDLIRRITIDTGSVSVIVNDALLPVTAAIFSLVSMFIIMWHMDTALTLLALIAVPFMILSVYLYTKPMNELSYRESEVEGEIYTVVEQTLSAIPAVQAFNREEQNEERLRETTNKTLVAKINSTKAQFQFNIFTGLSTALGSAAIIWVGGIYVLEGRLTVGTILVFISYLSSLYGPLESLMYTSMTISDAAGSSRRVMEILDTEQEVESRPGATVLTSVQGHIRFEKVNFGYETDRPILRDVSFEVLPGQTIALVGPTGAGKSSLVSLLPRFFDAWDGQITIDGLDVRDIELKSLRSNIGIVLQEPFLFPLTIAENIAYGRPDASREEIEAAARDANAHQFVERLPEGYNTIIGERGATLSGGERQRLSIARALLKNAPILILDEPTSALDAQTESLLLEALERLMKDKTTLIIAHRLSTIRKANQIIVLKNGRIIETGIHEELLKNKELYSFLYEIQFGPINTTGN
jgi:ATP-binding cassette subfamily B protein/subfamily B ATP-binding cassette protein MsbA